MIWISAATRNEVLNMVSRSPIYDELLTKYTSSKKYFNDDKRDEFKQYIWLILCEKPEEKILKAWNGKYFLYSFIRTIENSLYSKSSPWKYRPKNKVDIDFVPQFNEDIEDEAKLDIEIYEDELLRNYNLELINEAIEIILKNNPRSLPEFILFNLYYKDGKTYRDAAKVLNMPPRTAFDYIKSAEARIKLIINNKKQNIKKYI